MTDKAIDATEADKAKVTEANKANDAVIPAEANEANAVSEPGKADEAKVHKANEAANEADAKADKGYESKSFRGIYAKAEEAKGHD